jgi:hypothetical protein
VPRYFFHFTDGMHWFTDGHGHELAGLRAARAHALKDVRALTAALCERHVQNLSGWIMTVVDDTGKAVFALGFDCKPRLVPVEFLSGEARAALRHNVVPPG